MMSDTTCSGTIFEFFDWRWECKCSFKELIHILTKEETISRVTRFDLEEVEICDEELVMITECCPNVQYINLKRCVQIGRRGFLALGTWKNSLTHLNCALMNLCRDWIADFINLVGGFQELQTGIFDSCLEDFNEQEQSDFNETLLQKKIQDQEIFLDFVESFGETIQVLGLNDVVAVTARFAASLREKCPNLKSVGLNFPFWRFGDIEEVILGDLEILEPVPQNHFWSGLEEFSANNTLLENCYELLCDSDHLEKLFLDECRINRHSLKALLDKSKNTLTHFSREQDFVLYEAETEAEVTFRSDTIKALSNCTKLVELSIGPGQCSKEALEDMVKNCPLIKELVLENFDCDDFGCLKHLKCLTSLSLKNSGSLTNGMLKEILSERGPELEQLFFSGSSMVTQEVIFILGECELVHLKFIAFDFPLHSRNAIENYALLLETSLPSLENATINFHHYDRFKSEFPHIGWFAYNDLGDFS